MRRTLGAGELVQYGVEVPMPNSSRRRRHRRVDAVGRCFAQLGGGIEGSVQNLSVGGMLLRLLSGLTPGSSYLIKLFFEDRIAVVEARVVRLVNAGEEYLAGLEFVSLGPDDELTLRTYVRR